MHLIYLFLLYMHYMSVTSFLPQQGGGAKRVGDRINEQISTRRTARPENGEIRARRNLVYREKKIRWREEQYEEEI